MEQITKLKKHQKTEELDNYAEILRDVKSILENAKYRAYKAVDNLRVQAYWQIGERIVREELQHMKRADYGENLVEYLANDLGFDRRLFYRIVRFYRLYPIVVTLSPQLSWSHYEAFIGINDKDARQFYERQTIQNAWSVRETREQIQNNLYERMQKEGKIIIVPQAKPLSPENIFKNSYNFDFLNLPDNLQNQR